MSDIRRSQGVSPLTLAAALTVFAAAGCGGDDSDSSPTLDACAGVACSGHGECVVASGEAQCDCFPGYHAVALACEPGEPGTVTLFVATDGQDTWSGQLPSPSPEGDDGPFATIARAQEAVRGVKRSGNELPINVIVRGGTYPLRDTLRFTPDDSGTESAPITYRADGEEQVTIHGGHEVGGWREGSGGILEADLSAQGLDGVRFHQLFYRGVRQPMARHPNADPEHPRTGGVTYVERAAVPAAEGFFYEPGAFPFDTWSDVTQAEVVAVYGRGWNFAITPILEVDSSTRRITVERVRRAFEADNRNFVQNVRDALDAPGEWFLDYDSSLLSFRPPDGVTSLSDSDVIVPVLDHLIEVRGSIPYPHEYLNVAHKGPRDEIPMPSTALDPVEFLHFDGFRFEVARQDAVRLVGARNCSVTRNEVVGVGGIGINLGGLASAHAEVGNPRVTPAQGYEGGVGGGGQNLLFQDPCQECAVIGNDVSATGSDGIFLYGTANLAENNHVYDVGLYDKDCAAINVWGESNRARRNSLHDVPRNAVFIKGIDNVVELNAIKQTMLETCDGGAIRMCQRNLFLRGNQIRQNVILDTVGYGYPSGLDYESPYFAWGVYLDDYTCGTTVSENIVARAGRGGVMVHGGSDNAVTNNVLVDAPYLFEHLAIDDSVVGNQVERNVLVGGPDSAAYRSGAWLEDSLRFRDNLIWMNGSPPRVIVGSRVFEDWDSWLAFGADEGSIVADPQFANMSSDDFGLRTESPAWALGFQEITVDDFGCYDGEKRRTWPLVSPLLPLEDPVLHLAPSRPLLEDFESDLVGYAPSQANVTAPAPSSIRVTDQIARSGSQSVEVIDAASLPQVWNPNLYFPLNFSSGRVAFSVALRLDGQTPPDVMLELRQYREVGQDPYWVGPKVTIDQQGQLVAGTASFTIPLDRWVLVEVIMDLGDDATGSYELSVTPEGQGPQVFALPFQSSGFRRLERAVFTSNGDRAAIFHIDDVFCDTL